LVIVQKVVECKKYLLINNPLFKTFELKREATQPMLVEY